MGKDKNGMEYTGEQLILGAPAAAGRTQKEHLARYRFASGFVSGKRVLDIACGTGYGSAYLKKAGAVSVTGVDISEKAISFAKAQFPDAGVEYVQSNAQDYIRAESFDVITSFETIEHIKYYKLALSNLFSSLRPGGQLILSTPNRPITSPNASSLYDTPSNPYHVREFNLNEIVSAVKDAGFRLSDDGLFGQCRPLKFRNRALQKINRLFQKFSPRYGPQVRPIPEIATLKYIVLLAQK